VRVTREKIISTFNTKNYRNSPVIREFYRFVAKNGLRKEAFNILNNVKDAKKNLNYFSKLYN
jgi:hypothetical protein